MADVNIQQTPSAPATSSGGGSGAVWAILVIVLLAVIAWFVFGGGLHKTSTTKIDINTPGASAPSGGSGGTPSGGSGGGTGGTKTP
jgi:hypothetical protein